MSSDANKKHHNPTNQIDISLVIIMSKASFQLSQSLLEDQEWSCPFVLCNVDNPEEKHDISNYLVTTIAPYRDDFISSYCNLTKLFGFQPGDKDKIVKSMHLSAKQLGFQFNHYFRLNASNSYWTNYMSFKCLKSIVARTSKETKNPRSSQHVLTNEKRCCCITITIKLHKPTSEWYIIPHHISGSMKPSNYELKHSNHIRLDKSFVSTSKHLSDEVCFEIDNSHNLGETEGQIVNRINAISGDKIIK
jgi:hypothetical protein